LTEAIMKLKTKVFDICNGKYANLSELAQAMGISASQIYRVRQGKRHINEKFTIGAINAFPNHGLDELFYFESALLSANTEETTVTIRHKYIIQQYAKLDRLKVKLR